MNLNISRDMGGSRQETGVNLSEGFLALPYGGYIAEFGNEPGGPDGQAVPLQRHSHGGIERTKMGIERLAPRAEHYQFAGLIGGDEYRGAKLL